MPKLLQIDRIHKRSFYLPMTAEQWPDIDKTVPPYAAPTRRLSAMRSAEWIDGSTLPPCVIPGRRRRGPFVSQELFQALAKIEPAPVGFRHKFRIARIEGLPA